MDIVPTGWLDCLRTSTTNTHPIVYAFVRVSLDQTPEITKTKGALTAVFTPTLKSV